MKIFRKARQKLAAQNKVGNYLKYAIGEIILVVIGILIALSISEFGVTGNATLKGWDVSDRLKELTVPTLMIGGKYDTMDPNYMEWMSTEVQNGRSLTVNAGHVSQYDDPENYFTGLIKFIKDVNDGSF